MIIPKNLQAMFFIKDIEYHSIQLKHLGKVLFGLKVVLGT